MNIVVVDSGSTKADWIIYENGASHLITTPGINPSTGSGMDQHLPSSLAEYLMRADQIHFYAAGGSGTIAKERMELFFEPYITTTKTQLWIESDMLAAARAASGQKPAIVCILGTGSNSCLYDGEKITDQIPSLGYLLSDEGSGNHIGKLLLTSYFYREMTEEDALLFQSRFAVMREEVLRHLYTENGVSAYLAEFSIFLNYCSNSLKNKVLEKAFSQFIETRILKYNEFSKFDLYFAGSIADIYQDVLSGICKKYNLSIAGIVRKPIESLMQYHLSRELK